jgi:hypothetical protein
VTGGVVGGVVGTSLAMPYVPTVNPFQNSFVRLVQVMDETEPVKRIRPCGSPCR